MIKPLLTVVALGVLALCFRLRSDSLFHSSMPSSSTNPEPSTTSKLNHVLSPNSVQAIHNSTLGFGDVYIIHMPERTDKLDSIRLITSFTNISYKIIPGVDGLSMPHVAWPGFYKEGGKAAGITGCWRAHMNAAAAIIDNNLSSGLIVEDDADWDVHLKTQLTHFALGTRHILDASTSSEPLSPYGDNWDMLWIGHCAQSSPEQPFARFIIENDATVRLPNHRWHLWNPEKTLTQDLPNNRSTRVVYRSAGGCCSFAYALSYAGAQKFLYYLSYLHFNDPIDFGLARLCKRGRKGSINFACVTSYPGLVYTASTQNDINYHPDTPRKERTKKKKTPGARNLVFGARVELNNLIEGKEVQGRDGWEQEERENLGQMRMWFDEGEPEWAEPTSLASEPTPMASEPPPLASGAANGRRNF